MGKTSFGQIAGLAFLAGLLAGCSAASPINAPTTASGSSGTLTLSVIRTGNALVDVSVRIVDPSTGATVDSQTFLKHTTPFSCDFPVVQTPATVTVTMTPHLLPSAALHGGTNAGPLGKTLTDNGTNFTGDSGYPMFVVDNPSNPTAAARVMSVAGPNALNLASPFPPGQYFLFEDLPMGGQILWSSDGTSSYPFSGSVDAQTGIPWSQTF